MAEPARTTHHDDHAHQGKNAPHAHQGNDMPHAHERPLSSRTLDMIDQVVDNRKVVEDRGMGSGAIVVGIVLVLAVIAYFIFAPGMSQAPEPAAPATTSEPASPVPTAPAPMTPVQPAPVE